MIKFRRPGQNPPSQEGNKENTVLQGSAQDNVHKKHTENTFGEKTYETSSLKLAPNLIEFKDKVFEALLGEIDLRAAAQTAPEELKKEVESFITLFTQEHPTQITYREQQQIANDIVNDMVGLGPLEPLLLDESITDIMVNGPESVYVERAGKLEKTDVKFRSKKHVLQVSQRISNQVGRRIDESSPMVDARLKDGSRVNVIIPPLALDGGSISIRRFAKKSISFEKMVEQGNIGANMLKFLQLSSRSRLNILVSGGTGAGKTTLLNALSHLIDPKERIVTIEDSAELQLQQPHVVRLESRPPNIEGEGAVSIRDLVRNSLRMRPDRIVIGECRGAESFDMLQAMNTGHDGSLSTLHANSAHEALNRLENLVLMAGHDLPNTVIKNYIADAIDLIVHISRMRDGVRRVTEVMEVIECEGDTIKTQSIFSFEYHETDENDRIIGEFASKTQNLACASKFDLFNLTEDLKEALKGSEPSNASQTPSFRTESEKEPA